MPEFWLNELVTRTHKATEIKQCSCPVERGLMGVCVAGRGEGLCFMMRKTGPINITCA